MSIARTPTDESSLASTPDTPAAGATARLSERCTLAMLVVFALGAPHSIAVTQGAFIAGMVFWLLRCLAARRFVFRRTPVDIPVLVFVGWTLLSTALSAVPAYSAGRLRGVSLILILYLFASNVPSRRFAWILTLLFAVSTLGNLWWTYYDRFEGRGLRIESMAPQSPLRKWQLQVGDTILEANGRPVTNLADFDALFDVDHQRTHVDIKFLRQEGEYQTTFRKKPVRRKGTGVERLGVTVGPGRDFRARGFFSHPVTYSETLLLLGTLAAAWTIESLRRDRRWAIGMAALTTLIAGALVMTATRASLVSFAIACVAMVLLRGASRRVLAGALAAGVLLVAIGGAVVMSDRRVGFLDMQDQSTTWRLTVWREGLGLLGEHPVFGIGPDAAHEKWREWGLFAHGTLPPGHWHSTPLQIAVDRGLPALLAFLAVFGSFFVAGARLVRRLVADAGQGGDWRVTAAALGCWGGVLGTFASSFVHFNFGDSEVVEIMWALMGIAMALLALERRAREAADELRPAG